MGTPTSIWNHVAALAAVVLAAVLGGASCNLVLGLDKYETAGEGDAGTACGKSSDCDDHNACTVDTCGADGTCAHTNVKDGPAPAGAQIPFDCQQILCGDGVESAESDPTDIEDDGKSCTEDTCAGGAPHHAPIAAGTSCDDGKGTGQCDAQGNCNVRCMKDEDCPAPADPCSPQICNTGLGVCVDDPVQDGTPLGQQTDGDCQVVICVGGASTSSPDDTDLPAATNDCVIPQCDGGVPSQLAKPDGLNCTFNGGPGFCAKGACRECALDSNCPGTTNDCTHPACDKTSFTCGEWNAPSGTVTANPAQKAGDCQQKQCDGSGNVIDVFLAGDTLTDNNDCTTDTCVAGAPGSPPAMSYTALADGHSCATGGGTICYQGKCKGCVPASTCQPATCVGNVLYKAATCATDGTCPTQVQQSCGAYKCVAGASCPTSCTADTDCADPTNYFCNSAKQCVTKLVGGACSRDAMCASGHCTDGVCCNVAACGPCQACAAALKLSGSDGTCGAAKANSDPHNDCAASAASTCGFTGMCDGAGACAFWPAGTSCGNQSCSTGTNQYTGPKTCNGTGTCVTPSTVSCTPYLCAGSGNFACATTCSSDSGCATSPASYCNGANQCKAKAAAGGACTGTGSGHDCTSGICGSNGICCVAACIGAAPCGTTVCAPGTGACSYPPSGTPCGSGSCSQGSLTPPSLCNGSGTCNGSAPVSCSPYACATATTCASSCPSNDPVGDGWCAGGYYCDGVGCVAGQLAGSSCSRSAMCASGSCSFATLTCN
jgi:hypothetical protein